MKITINYALKLLYALALILCPGGAAYADPTYVYYFDTLPPASVKNNTGNGSCEFLGNKGTEKKELANGKVIDINIYYYKCGASGDHSFSIQSQGVKTAQGYMLCRFQVKSWSTGIFMQNVHHKVTPLNHSNSCIAYGENNTWAVRNKFIAE